MGLATIDIRFRADLQDFSNKMANASRKINKMSRKFKKVGANFSKYLTAPIVGFGVISVKTFADFEQQMAKVEAISGATGTAFERLKQNALQLGRSTRYTASEVAQLQLNYSKLGFAPDEIEKVTGATLDLALATGEDLADSATVAASTLRGFGLDASRMNEVVDVMAKSFSSSALDLEKFKTAMAILAPVAKNAGVSMQQTTGLLSVLVDRGVDASTAGTGLRNMFLELSKKGISLTDALNKINNSSDRNATALALFGKRGATVASIIAENIGQANKLAESYYDSAGAAKHMAGIMDNTLQGKLLKLKSAFQDMAIQVGERLKPVIEKLASFLSKLANKFSQLSPHVQKVVIAIAGIAAAVGPLMMIAGTALPAMMTGFSLLLSPITLVVAAIAGVAYAVIKYWKPIKRYVLDVVNYFVDLYNESSAVRIGIEYIKFGFKSMWEFMKLGLKSLVNLFKAWGKIIKGVFTLNWDKIKQGYADFAKSFVDNVKVMAGHLKDDFKTAIDNVKKNHIELVSDVSVDPEQIQEDINKKIAIKKPVVPVSIQAGRTKHGKTSAIDLGNIDAKLIPIEKKVKRLPKLLKKVNEDMKNWAAELTDILQNTVANFAVGFGELIGDIASGAASFADIGGLLIKGIAGLLKALGQAAIKIGVGMIAVKKAFLNPVTAIAAGVAMVALGALMENAFKSAAKPMASGGIAYTPTYAYIGEYANARKDPEVVAPLSKLKNMLGNTAGNVQIVETGKFVLSGSDLKLVMDREVKRQKRTRG